MSAISLPAARYYPSAPLAGNERVIYRASNCLLRGREPYTYFQAYAGSENINEQLPTLNISGTVTFTSSFTTVTGSGTAFLDELHLGQRLQAAGGEPLVVERIIDQETFINARVPTSDAAGVVVSRLPNLFALDNERGSQLAGNAQKFDKGTIISVGQGELYVNGAVLAGESLTATRRAQVAIYDSGTQTYTVEDVGFDNSPTLTNSAITVVGSGGTKNMSAGYYSFMVAYYSDITSGYSNPTDVLLSGGTAGYQITAASSTFRLDKSADTPPDKATGYIIYATAFGGSSAISQVNAIQGPWYELKRVPFTDFTGAYYSFDYVDADLSTTFATQDNDTPPDAEFVTVQAGFLNLVSTNGAGVDSTGREASTSPGPMVTPMSAYNFDGFPATTRVPTEGGETIIGYVTAAGRLFVMTPNSLQASTPTGLPTAPFTLRPFWKRGFVSPDNLLFVDDTLYGFSGNKMFRSIATGDTAQESYDFASDVEAQLNEVSAGYVFVTHDPKNELVCVFASAIRLNDDSFWETDVFCYSLTKGQWMPTVTLSSTDSDWIISGAAEVNGSLYFVAGGRVGGVSNTYHTYKFDSPDGEQTPWYICWAMQDLGVELVPKNVTRMRPKGKYTNATMSLYGVAANEVVDVTDLETGDNPILSVALDDSTEVTQYQASKVRSKNLMMLTARIDGTCVDGADEHHELVLNCDVVGSIK